MSSTPVTVAAAVAVVKAIDAPVIDAVVIDATANTTNTKKVKKVRVPTTQALEAATAVESGSGSESTAAPPAPAADAAVPEKKKRVVKKTQEKEKEKEKEVVAAVTEVVQAAITADESTADESTADESTVVVVAPVADAAVADAAVADAAVAVADAAVAAVAVADAAVAAVADAKAKKVKKVRVQALEASTAVDSGSAPADAATAAAAAAAPEKKKRVVKKPQEKEAAAVTEVVQMVADMKTAFTEVEVTEAAVEATHQAAEVEVEVAATLVAAVTETVVADDTDAELVLDTYIELPPLGDFDDFEPLVELEFGDSFVDFEELRLDGDETPCCNPIPEPIQEESEPVAVAAVASEAVRPVRPVFRFEFSPECFELLNGFARENLGVPRKEYKAKWEQFATDHAEFIAQESARLADAGYDGDVLVKMFKTVKYYLTKRVKAAATASAVVDALVEGDEVVEGQEAPEVDDDDATVDAEDAPAPPVQGDKTRTRRRHYTTLDRAVLEAMDSHITSSISSNSKPATCYASFCDQFRNSIETEIARLVRYDDGVGADADIVRVDAFAFTEKTAEEKLKKTYKNRMFLHIRNM